MKACLTRLNLRLLAAALFSSLVAAFFAGETLNSRAFAPLVSSFVSTQGDKLKDSRSIEEGARLFGPNCSSGYCHGAGGAGGGGPRLRGKALDADYVFKVISNGVAGTPMMAFKSELSEEEIWKLVAYIMSEAKASPEVKSEPSGLTPPAPAPKATTTVTGGAMKSADAATASFIGNAQAGKSLFFDSAQPRSCRACHSFAGEGSSIGIDLSTVGSKTARELFLSIIIPRDTAAGSRYSKLILTLKNGDKVAGIKKDEDDESIRIYDITELPAVLRTIQKANVAGIEATSESPMPKDYASTYTVKQLLDIVAYLKSSDPQSKPVTLRDLF
ncbi:MAG TPA: c-type cytochrome [Blastocatellia bacterium]|nr:c-type cytochrome [Blastocatellia bacterium]